MKGNLFSYVATILLLLSVTSGRELTCPGDSKKSARKDSKRDRDWRQDWFPNIHELYEKDEKEVVMNADTFGGTNVTFRGMTLRHEPDVKPNITVFRGIKFADALRFQPPLSNDNHSDDTQIDAEMFGPCCMTTGDKTDLLSYIYQDEDCQYLNIYTPDDPEVIKARGESLPVMMWIYGGSFLYGCGAYYFPHRIIAVQDVIVVTMNYRLGALGFYTLNNDTAPGNYALLDQREALRWINRHIEDWGGNKSQVTVFGESAGACSTSYMTIVAENDTIHAAISESGTFSEPWAFDSKPEFAARFIAECVGCYDSDIDYINMTCMDEANAYDLTQAEKDLTNYDEDHGGMGFNGCAPTIQGEDVSEEYRILPKYPWELYEDGEFNDVPYLMGTNRDDGSIGYSIFQDVAQGVGIYDDPIAMREELIQLMLSATGAHDPSYSLSNTLYLQYCKDVDIADFYGADDCLIDLAGVFAFKAGGMKTANLHAKYATSPTYYYTFDYDDHRYWLDGKDEYYVGIGHAEELLYVFFGWNILSAAEKLIALRMDTIWTNIAKYGEPTPEEDDNWESLGVPKFLPFDYRDHHFMLMQKEFVVQKEFPLRWTIRREIEKTGVYDIGPLEPPQTPPPPPTTTLTPTTSEVETEGPDPGTGPPNVFKRLYSKDDTAKHGQDIAPMMKTQDDVAKQGSHEIAAMMKTQDDVDDMEDKRDAYMITMIVFIVLFCLMDCVAIYFFYKWKKTESV